MTKYIITLLIIVVSMVSCSKDEQTEHVEYMITGLTDPYTIVMLDDEGNSISETVSPLSPAWEYSQSYDIEKGEPVYLYVKFKENTDNSPKFSVGIIIDSKYRYQRRGYDKTIGDSIYEVKIAGIVPL